MSFNIKKADKLIDKKEDKDFEREYQGDFKGAVAPIYFMGCDTVDPIHAFDYSVILVMKKCTKDSKHYVEVVATGTFPNNKEGRKNYNTCREEFIKIYNIKNIATWGT